MKAMTVLTMELLQQKVVEAHAALEYAEDDLKKARLSAAVAYATGSSPADLQAARERVVTYTELLLALESLVPAVQYNLLLEQRSALQDQRKQTEERIEALRARWHNAKQKALHVVEPARTYLGTALTPPEILERDEAFAAFSAAERERDSLTVRIKSLEQKAYALHASHGEVIDTYDAVLRKRKAA